MYITLDFLHGSNYNGMHAVITTLSLTVRA